MNTITAVNSSRVPPLPWRNCPARRLHSPQQMPFRVSIAPTTGPLDQLHGRRILTLIDVENVTISCRNLGFEVNYSRLADLFARVACSLSLHAVLSVDAGDRLDRAHMENAGFHVHTRLIRYLPGGRKTANADNLFAFKAGAIVSRSRADVVVLGTGDGQLCDDVVQCIKALPGSRQVLTLSVAGSTSSFLNARTHSSIAANIEIGKDLLAPLYAAAAS